MTVNMILVLVPLAVLAFKGFGVEGPSALHVETTGKMPRDSTSWAPKASSQGVIFTPSLEGRPHMSSQQHTKVFPLRSRISLLLGYPC